MYAVLFLGRIKFTSYHLGKCIDYKNKLQTFWFDGDRCILDVSTLKFDKPKIITIKE